MDVSPVGYRPFAAAPPSLAGVASLPARPVPPPTNFPDEAPLPIVSEQLDQRLGISVLELQSDDNQAPTSFPSQKKLDAYAVSGGPPAASSHIA